MIGRRRHWAGHFAATVAPALWLGMLVGVSFVATPVKFTAPSLDLPTALDVGRVTFALFNKLEWLLAVASGIAIVSSAPSHSRPVLWSLLILVLGVQTFWLLPVLDERVRQFMSGNAPPDSWHHTGYAALEGGKFLILGGLTWLGLSRLAHLR